MLSAYARDLLLAWMLTTGSATRPTTWFVSLHTGDPGTTGANELSTGTDADYVRKAITFAAPSAGASASSVDATWTANAGAAAHDITHVGIWDSLSGGNFLNGGALAVPEPRIAGGSTVLATGRCIAALT